MVDRPKCGRPTRSGVACKAIVRRSAALEAFAPACRKHMTPAERQELDANPLWSEEGQILWLFDQQGDNFELLTAAEIANRLKLPLPAVSHVLQQLRQECKVGECTAGRHELWGTYDQVVCWLGRRHQEEQRLALERDAAHAHIVEANNVLADVARQLREICADHGVAVEIVGGLHRESEEPRKHALVLSVDDPAASSWLLGRLSRPAPDEGAPTDEQWGQYADHLEQLLGSLGWAGWSEHENDYFVAYDRESGPVLCTTLRRTCMALDVEYRPVDQELRLLPHDDGGGWPQIFSMLESEVVIELDGDAEEQAQCVAQRAGELGLLDATRVKVDEHSDVSPTQFMNVQLAEYVFEEAARYRDRPVLELAEELDEDPCLITYFAAVVGMFGCDVLPDLVPAAAVLGIAAWGWRNDTAVEAWHVTSDVLMARINIAVTKVIDEHVDPFEGVDWAGLQLSLIDPAWSLPDGRKVSELFGEGWPEICDTVSERLGEWRRLDEDVLGPEAALRLLTIGGSTSYTRHWWGQGRWSAMCRTVVEDAVDGGIALPSPYSELGVERFVADLAEPDQLSDEVLEWLIDMPGGGVDGPHGLRFHEASRPISRAVEPAEWNTD